jgi:hypothetical protein
MENNLEYNLCERCDKYKKLYEDGYDCSFLCDKCIKIKYKELKCENCDKHIPLIKYYSNKDDKYNYSCEECYENIKNYKSILFI